MCERSFKLYLYLNFGIRLVTFLVQVHLMLKLYVIKLQQPHLQNI